MTTLSRSAAHGCWSTRRFVQLLVLEADCAMSSSCAPGLAPSYGRPRQSFLKCNLARSKRPSWCGCGALLRYCAGTKHMTDAVPEVACTLLLVDQRQTQALFSYMPASTSWTSRYMAVFASRSQEPDMAMPRVHAVDAIDDPLTASAVGADVSRTIRLEVIGASPRGQSHTAASASEGLSSLHDSTSARPSTNEPREATRVLFGSPSGTRICGGVTNECGFCRTPTSPEVRYRRLRSPFSDLRGGLRRRSGGRRTVND